MPFQMQQYSLPDIKKTDQIDVPVEDAPEKENPADAISEEVVDNTSETPAPESVAEKSDQTAVEEEASAVEETNTNETTTEQETEDQPDDEKPEIKVNRICSTFVSYL